MKVGVLSDTHGLLRPEALKALTGADYLLHAGDVGDPLILDKLRELAPLAAIRGNIDRAGLCALLPSTEAVELGGRLIYLVHSLADLDLQPKAAGISVVISGHSHKPGLQWREDVLYLNPGSCGPRRFSLPVTMAWLYLEPEAVRAEVVELTIPAPSKIV